MKVLQWEKLIKIFKIFKIFKSTTQFKVRRSSDSYIIKIACFNNFGLEKKDLNTVQIILDSKES